MSKSKFSVADQFRMSLLATMLIAANAAVGAGQNHPTDVPIDVPAPSVEMSAGASYDPQGQATVAYHDANVDLKLMPWNGRRYRLLVQDRISAAELIDLPPELQNIHLIQRANGNKAVLFGATDNDIEEVVVFDWIQHSLLDKFWCYVPSLSPNRRFIAFVHYFPAHIVDGVGDNQYRLYDLQQSASDNRPSADNTGFDSDINVGAPLYPLKADEIDRPESKVDETNAHRSLAGSTNPTFFWSPDTSMLAFGDLQTGVLSLIVSNLPGKTTAKLSTRSYVLKGPDEVAPGIAIEDLMLTDVGFDHAQINANLLSQRDEHLGKTLNIPLDQFHPVAR